MDRNFNINLKNGYVYDIVYYINNSDNRGFIPMNETYKVSLYNLQPLVLEVPGMGQILVQFLGEKVIAGLEEAAYKSIQVEQDGEKHIITTESHSHGAIVRYQNRELYCKFDEHDITLDLEIDEYGSLSPIKISQGSYALINIPKISIK